MAFRTQKISQMTPKGADLEATDLIEVSTIESGSYVTRSITGQELIDAIPLPPSGLTIGTTPISSGTIGRVLFEGTGNVLQESANLFWDNTNGRLGIGTSTPTDKLHVLGGNTNIFKIQSNVANLFNQFVSTDGTGEYGIFNDAFYFQPLTTLANGLRFLNGANAVVLQMSQVGNIQIGTTTDAGFKLDVNGTARVQGNTTVSLNQNATTSLTIQNTTSGTSSQASLTVVSNSTPAQFAKLSTGLTPYKSLAAGDLAIYNTSSDISLLTEGTGRIKFAAGGVSSAQMTLFATGNLGINTTTDAGFRLDVNGTARVQGDLSSTGIITASSRFTQTGSNANTFPGIINHMGAAQSVSGFNTTRICANTDLSVGFAGAPDASAVVELRGTTKGFLPPRMTTTQRNAIASPAAGLIVYDTTLNLPHFFNGTIWVSL